MQDSGLKINRRITIPEREIQLDAVRSTGPGGQNVNKVATAIHLRFDIPASSLPARAKQRLLQSGDSRINREGVLVIKSQRCRSQERNREAALERLKALISDSLAERKQRIPTRPGKAAEARRLAMKRRRSKLKMKRSKPLDTDNG